MLSILIPVYNFDIRKLVRDLHSQATNAGVVFEILVFDDFSHPNFFMKNREIMSLTNVVYKELDYNIGRSKIRNKLCEESKYEYLLFMDSDANVPSDNFISNYIKECNGDVVVCGGTGYSDSFNHYSSTRDYFLRFNYGHKRECKNADSRKLSPNTGFSTFNFLISRNILSKIRFNEDFSQYGHEDTLLGIELKKNNIVIKHIENPLFHLELDSNKVFISKTLSGVKNLNTLIKRDFYTNELSKEIKLVRYYKILKTYRLTFAMALFYKVSHKPITRNLENKGSNLFYFDILKLGYLCSLS